MPKQLQSISAFIIRLNPDSLNISSVLCVGVADDGTGYKKEIHNLHDLKDLSTAEQDAAITLVKYAKSRIETEENLNVLPDPVIPK